MLRQGPGVGFAMFIKMKFVQWISQVTGRKINQLYSYCCSNTVGPGRRTRDFCESQDILHSAGVWPEETLEFAPTTTYGARVMDTGLQGDTIELSMVLATCLLGYGGVGLRVS